MFNFFYRTVIIAYKRAIYNIMIFYRQPFQRASRKCSYFQYVKGAVPGLETLAQRLYAGYGRGLAPPPVNSLLSYCHFGYWGACGDYVDAGHEAYAPCGSGFLTGYDASVGGCNCHEAFIKSLDDHFACEGCDGYTVVGRYGADA